MQMCVSIFKLKKEPERKISQAQSEYSVVVLFEPDSLDYTSVFEVSNKSKANQ